MIRAIVAMTPSGLIGAGGTIPWRYPADFQHFKRRTMGGVCVMGRKTFESIPRTKSGEILPGRRLVVCSRRSAEHFRDGAAFEFSIDRAIETAQFYANGGDIWICGGASVYEVALPYVEEIHVTYVPEVDAEPLNPVRWPIDAPEPDDERIVGHAQVQFRWVRTEYPPGFAEAGIWFEVLRRVR